MLLLPLSPCVLLLLGAACGDSAGGGGAGGEAAGGGGSGGEPPAPIVTELTPDQPPLPGQSECKVTITDHVPDEGHTHVEICTEVDYQSNPPSSGNHWPIWAEFRTHTTPVPREMLVHNLEHGAIVMRHRCDPACPDVVAAFEAAAEDFGVDNLCVSAEGNAERSRIVISPDPQLDAPIGLSAWRATYVATCLDPESIQAFITDHYGQGPENVCREGKDPLDPTVGVLGCL